MLRKGEADPAWTGLSRFGPVGALQRHNSCLGRPCSRAGATLRDGSPSPRSGAPRHRRKPRNGPARPAAARSWSRLQPESAPGFPPRPAGPQTGGGQEAPVSGFSRRSRACGRAGERRGKGAPGPGLRGRCREQPAEQ